MGERDRLPEYASIVQYLSVEHPPLENSPLGVTMEQPWL